MATSTTPPPTRPAASAVACCEEPHCASTVVAATEIGSPAVSHAVRVMFMVCSPTWSTQPPTTCPTSAGSMPERSTTSRWTSPSRRAGCTPDRAPFRRPMGVLTASTTTASAIRPLDLSLPGAARGASALHEAEQVPGDIADLDLLRALGDPVPPVVAVDVLELLVARVADAAVDLHRAVRRVADEAVRTEIAHRDPVADAAHAAGAAVHLGGRLAHERA